MRISTKGRYALRLMIDLAEHDDGSLISIRDVAERQGISAKYLEQIVGLLSKAGFLRSGRGPQGGYRLSRAPEEYTVGDILRLTEGNLAPVSCTAQGAAACSRSTCCQTLPMWERLDKMINGFFEGITIADLLKDGGAT